MRNQTKSTGWKKIDCTDTDRKKAGVTILDKVITARNIIMDVECDFLMKMGSALQEG